MQFCHALSAFPTRTWKYTAKVITRCKVDRVSYQLELPDDPTGAIKGETSVVTFPQLELIVVDQYVGDFLDQRGKIGAVFVRSSTMRSVPGCLERRLGAHTIWRDTKVDCCNKGNC